MYKDFYCDDRTVVQIDSGLLRGAYLNGVYYFRGIPYAEAERFCAPHPVEAWDGVRNAVTYSRVAPTIKKPDCVGNAALDSEPLFGYRFRPEGEYDCMTINVWTRDISGSNPKKPVMVWIHGGGFATGSSVEQLSYDGMNLCRDGDVVVVSFNHRLNILGFLDLSDFGEKYANSGNAGMEDIVEALRWVQRNIAAFGGDPDNVTLFGQSGGGGKIMTLLQMPVAENLFHRGIIQSGLKPDDVCDEKNRTDGRRVGREIVKELGLTKENVDEIRNFSFDELRDAFLRIQPRLDDEGTFTGWGPVPNGYYENSLMSGKLTEKAKKTPLIVGCTAAEHCLWTDRFVPYDRPETEKMALLQKMYGNGTDEMLRLFREAYPDKDLMHLYHMDCLFRLATLHFLDWRAEVGGSTYAYLLDYDFRFFGTMPSYHGAELPLVFNNTDTVDAYNEPDAQALGVKMSSAWASFAHDGNPNTRLAPEWKPYSADGKYTMVFGHQCELKNNFDRELQEAHQRYFPVATIRDIFRSDK